MDSIPQPSAPAEVSVSDGPSAVASSAVVSEPPVHAEVTQQQTPSTSIGEETTIPSSSTFADQTTADPSISAEPSTVTIGSSAELGSGALHQPEAAQSTVDAGQTTPETSSASQRKPDKHVAAPAAVPSDDPTAQSRPATIEAIGDYPEQSDAAPKENEAIDTAPITAPVGFSAETGLPQGSVPVAEDLTVAAPSSTAEASVPSSAPDSGSIVALPSASEAAADQHSTVEAAQGTVQTAEASVSEQFRAAETQGKVSSTPASIPQPSATLTEPQQETAATAPTDARATTSAAAEASSAPTIAPTKSNEVAEPSKQDDASTQKANQVEQSTASASDHPKESATTTVDEAATKSSSSADDVTSELALQLAPASKAVSESTPATPEKKASADGANSAHSDASLPSTPARESKVALILRINKELIRLCVELQSKNLTTEPVYREAAVRLQANLGYLASIADQAGKSVDSSGRATPSGTLPPLEPFPRSEHAPSSPLPALFDKLIALFGSARSSDSPVADGKKRSRDSTADLSADDPRKRAASKGIEQSQDAPKASTPSSTSNLQQQTGLFTTMTPGSALSTTTTTSQREQQSAAPAPHAEQQQSQQPSKGPDLSLAPPVPIAPPTAAQNIPNNPQAQALMQAFGPNALVNLHTLQSHLRGQGTHPWVAYMENNVNGFKAMPLQVQLQHMTSLQNAALQRQKAMGGQGSAAPGSAVGSPATMSNGGQGGVSSPATTRPVSRHSDSPGQAQASPSASAFGGAGPGRTGTPLGGGQGAFQNRPGSSGSVGSMTSAGGRNRTGSSNLAFDPSQLQSAPSPATLGSIGDFAAQQQFGFQAPGLQQGSPAASAGSPSQQQQQQQQQQGPQQATGMPMSGMPNFQNLPPHLQQQIRQQYMAHMQAQAQAQGGNPQQMSFNPQQQQQQPQQQQQQPQAWNFQSPQ
ncbi:hypothetical protein PHSY_002593 [Pseudozyma hubeiensis SY62]|uniref:Uncharacterized protein n=1 Tax=Pseudozyma hubeiensis (strain SY62) TaxID=1305764 RepID=R9P160_PSEHS|nr:hypothetical protein PHSY_002593 [Pseudozyma hubeiensis SY62]GAC95018.1 hypothetical protein PHSY_002593 [Pseudozyma hubeiensis SY62]